MTIDCVLAADALLGACPLWSNARQVLHWIDIEGRRVRTFDPATGTDTAIDTPGRPGSIALTEDENRLLVAMEHQLFRLDLATQQLEPWLELEAAGTGNRLNDGRCDPAGRFWVGSMYEDVPAHRFRGKLHRIDAAGTATVIRDEVGVSNGLAFSPDGATMYWADTLYDTVWAFDYDPNTGAVGNQRLFVDFADLPGRPDGACVDAEGCYWVAAVYGWALLRISPDGRVDRTIDLPVEKPTMCAFGGPGLSTLYVTSIGEGGAYDPASGQQHPGGIFALEPGVTGLPEPVFAG